MPSISISKHIDAAPSRTFAVFSDFPNAPALIRGIKKLELTTPGPVRQGTRFKETRVMFGKEATEEMEIVEFEPGKSYAFACESCGAYFHSRFTFAPEGSGTRVELRLETQARSLFAKLMSPLTGLMLKQVVKACEQDVEDLRKACEGGGDLDATPAATT